MRWLDDIIDSMDISLNKFQKIATNGEARHAAGLQGVGMTERLNNIKYPPIPQTLSHWREWAVG